MNSLFASAKQAFLDGLIAWRTDAIVCVLVDTAVYGYSPNHASLADIPVGGRVKTSGTLANRTSTGGVADADDLAFGTVTGRVSAAVVYKAGVSDLASPLITYIDQGQTFPATAAGEGITLFWDNGTSKIFAL